MTTVEEHIAGLRATGERMPSMFIRSGLVYELHRSRDLGDYYIYEPCEPFAVNGIVYSPSRRSPGLLLYSLSPFGGSAGSIRMNHARPPTEEELDWWVRTPDAAPYLSDPADLQPH